MHSDAQQGVEGSASARVENGGDIVVNVQGDEPLLIPGHIDEVIRSLEKDNEADIGTAAYVVRGSYEGTRAAFEDPNVVKCVAAADGAALYFSRSPIPYRSNTTSDKSGNVDVEWLRHIGIYAFRSLSLKRFVELRDGKLEAVESLEQLRALEAGMRIQVASLDSDGLWEQDFFSGGVDTPQQIHAAEEEMRRRLSLPSPSFG